MLFCELIKFARKTDGLIESLYMSDIDSTEVDFMYELALDADSANDVYRALSILHTLRNTTPRKGKPIGGREAKELLLKKGLIVSIDFDNIRGMDELVDKLKDQD